MAAAKSKNRVMKNTGTFFFRIHFKMLKFNEADAFFVAKCVTFSIAFLMLLCFRAKCVSFFLLLSITTYIWYRVFYDRTIRRCIFIYDCSETTTTRVNISLPLFLAVFMPNWSAVHRSV